MQNGFRGRCGRAVLHGYTNSVARTASHHPRLWVTQRAWARGGAHAILAPWRPSHRRGDRSALPTSAVDRASLNQ